MLMRYKAYLWQLKIDQELIDRETQDLATLKTPEKRTTMAPGACPEGQGGGLLAGWINSVTGSDLAAVCDIDVRREKNKEGGAGRDLDREHEHGDE
ncbi:MAG: hypothetical protein ACREEP_03125 [Dongiaceae bacterium]